MVPAYWTFKVDALGIGQRCDRHIVTDWLYRLDSLSVWPFAAHRVGKKLVTEQNGVKVAKFHVVR